MLSRISCVGSVASVLRRGVLSSQARRMVPMLFSVAANANSAAPATQQAPVHDHSFHFKMERYFAAAMLPLYPAAYFIHGPVMDYALSATLVLHIHWGLTTVVEDYARPIVVGEKFAAIAPKAVYLLSAVLLASLLHFNYNDVGLTRAFEMVFAL